MPIKIFSVDENAFKLLFQIKIMSLYENFPCNIRKKIKERDELEFIIKDLRTQNPEIKIVTTNGAFDLLHPGHIKSLADASSYGDKLIVGINSDSSVKQYKTDLRPILSQEYRSIMLASISFVDYVTIFYEKKSLKFLESIRPDFHIKSKEGYDGSDGTMVEKYGGKIILVDDLEGISTSLIIESIIEKYSKTPPLKIF